VELILQGHRAAFYGTIHLEVLSKERATKEKFRGLGPTKKRKKIRPSATRRKKVKKH